MEAFDVPEVFIWVEGKQVAGALTGGEELLQDFLEEHPRRGDGSTSIPPPAGLGIPSPAVTLARVTFDARDLFRTYRLDKVSLIGVDPAPIRGPKRSFPRSLPYIRASQKKAPGMLGTTSACSPAGAPPQAVADYWAGNRGYLGGCTYAREQNAESAMTASLIFAIRGDLNASA